MRKNFIKNQLNTILMIQNFNNLYLLTKNIEISKYLNIILKLYKNEMINIVKNLLYNYKKFLFIKIN